MSSRRGIFGALLFAAILVMPLTTFNVNAQEYIDHNEYNDKNKDYYFYPPKDKKQDPMLVVIKELFICDSLINEQETFCGEEPFFFPEPNSGRYLECTDNVCDPIEPESFDIIIEDKLVFEGSEEGKKINFNGERYTVTEESDLELNDFRNINFGCQNSGFDEGLIKEFNILGQNIPIAVCAIFEGDCSGILQKGELKECTVENYVVATNAET